jgi:hypothetical protein
MTSFCVPFLDVNRAVDLVYSWSSLEWYSINIHMDSPVKVYPKRLNPFWKGQTLFFDAFRLPHLLFWWEDLFS